MSTLASLLVKLGIDAGGFHKGVGDAERAAGGLLGTLGKLAVPVAVGAGVMSAGKMIWEAGQAADEAMDTIATKTGLTGAALDQLGADYQAVFKSIPTDANTAAAAVAELAARTGAAGPPLQEATAAVVEMSRLTGGDALRNTQAFADMMGKWHIPIEQGAGSLDKLFATSQATGVGMDKLMSIVTQFGAPLQQFGMSFEEAAAVVAKLEKGGVNTEKAMGGLTTALGTWAKEGKKPEQELNALIKKIRATEDASEATKLAVTAFGAKAGPELAGAIRNGAFSVDLLMEKMDEASGSIAKTADATADYPEKMQELRNKLTTALAPMGLTMMDLVTQAVEKGGPLIERVLGVVSANLPQIVTVLGVIAGIVAGMKVASTVGEIAGALGALTNPIGLVIAIVGVLAAAWAGNWGGIRDKAAEVWAVLQPIFAQMTTWLQTNIPVAIQFLSDLWNTVLLPAIQAVWGFIQENVLPILSTLWTWLQTNIPVAIQFLSDFWNTVLLPAITAVWGFIQEKLLPLITALAEVGIAILSKAVEALAGLWQNVLQPALATVWKFIQEKVLPIFESTATVVRENLGPALEWLRATILDPVAAAFDKIGQAISNVIGWLKNLAGNIGTLKLPDWLTPGWPTPFEIGLWGIADALQAVAATDVPLFGAGPNLALATAGMPGGAGGAGRLSTNYVINIGAIHAPNGDPEQVRRAAGEGVTEAARALGLI